MYIQLKYVACIVHCKSLIYVNFLLHVSQKASFSLTQSGAFLSSIIFLYEVLILQVCLSMYETNRKDVYSSYHCIHALCMYFLTFVFTVHLINVHSSAQESDF